MTMTLNPSRSIVSRMARDVLHLGNALSAIVRTAKNRRIARHVSDLSDDLLADIGLKRDDVHAALRARWRDDPTLLLHERATKRDLED